MFAGSLEFVRCSRRGVPVVMGMPARSDVRVFRLGAARAFEGLEIVRDGADRPPDPIRLGHHHPSGPDAQVAVVDELVREADGLAAFLAG